MLDYRNLKNLEKDDLLRALGLQSRRSASDYIIPAVSLFGAGLLVGAGVALLFAPQPGSQLRQDLRGRLQGTGDGHTAGEFTATPLTGVEKARTL